MGRCLIALLFLAAGFGKLAGWDAQLAYMASKGVPFGPWALGVAAFMELAFGLCLLAGFHTRFAASALFLFLIPVSLMMHAFWAVEDPMARQMEMVQFLKNLCIMGGLTFVAANGAGAWSLDGRLYGRRATGLSRNQEMFRGRAA